jgi:hypothetical protein
MGDDLSSGIEEILGRKVIAFLSANHVDPDNAIEMFILALASRRAQTPSRRDGTRPFRPAERLFVVAVAGGHGAGRTARGDRDQLPEATMDPPRPEGL